jgi:hypothetical protein
MRAEAAPRKMSGSRLRSHAEAFPAPPGRLAPCRARRDFEMQASARHDLMNREISFCASENRFDFLIGCHVASCDTNV